MFLMIVSLSRIACSNQRRSFDASKPAPRFHGGVGMSRSLREEGKNMIRFGVSSLGSKCESLCGLEIVE